MNKQHDYIFLEARINQCKTVYDTYIVFDEISDYIETYNVSYMAYRKIFDKCMNKYKELIKKLYY